MTDPTRIDIRFDPSVQRMSGLAVHGDTPFDVPFISEVTDGLWQGGCQQGLVLPRFIDHVVSLYPWEKYDRSMGNATYTEVRMYDDLEGPDRDEVMKVASIVNMLRQDGVVLVHCQAGLNRSGLIVGMALMMEGMNPQDAIELLRKSRSPAVLCNPVFEQFLLDF